jgi:hypothetical protein
MKTGNELNSDILEMTMKINKKFLELSKFIDEMPTDISPALGNKVDYTELSEYYNSLNALFNKRLKGIYIE